MNKRQLKKMSRVAAAYLVCSGRVSKFNVFISKSNGMWCADRFDHYDNYVDTDTCSQVVRDAFVHSIVKWNESGRTIYVPKGYMSLSFHKRLLFAINYLKTQPAT